MFWKKKKKKKRSSDAGFRKGPIARIRTSISDSINRFFKLIGEGFNAITEAIEESGKSIFSAIGEVFKFLSAIIFPAWLVKKLTPKQSKTAKKLGKQVGELTETVEKQFTSSATGLVEAFTFVGQIIFPVPLRTRLAKMAKAISTSSVKLLKRISKRFWKIAERYLPQWLFNLLRRLSLATKRFNRNIARFFEAWWKSRNFNQLAWSTPAFLLLLPIGLCLILSVLRSDFDQIRHYRRVAIEADEAGQPEVADLYRAKLRQLGYLKMELAEYEAARLIAEKGDWDAAYERMKALAPLPALTSLDAIRTRLTAIEASSPDPQNAAAQGQADPSANAGPTNEESADDMATGFIYAHLWIMKALFDEQVTPGTKEEIELLLDAHVSQALILDSENEMANYYKIKIDERRGIDTTEAKRKLAEKFPQFAYELMIKYAQASNGREMRGQARRFIRHMESKGDTWSQIDFVRVAQAYEILNDKLKMANVIEQGSKQHPDAPVLNRPVARRLYAEWRQTRTQGDEAALNDVKELAIALFRCDISRDETSLLMYQDVAAFLANQKLNDESKPASKRATAIIDELKQDEQVHPAMYLAIGRLLAQKGRWQEVEAVAREALEIDETTIQAYNNIAWIKSNIEPVQMDEALQMANRAVELAELSKTDQLPRFCETRGQIHFKRGNWQATITDLRRALNGELQLDELLQTHSALARSYNELGQPEAAAAHRSKADTYRALVSRQAGT